MAAAFTEDDKEITLGFFETLKNQKNNSDFSDLVVMVGSSEFQCHRVIMAAVSGFFRGLLASGMKEVDEGKVTLKELSGEAFSHVLTCVYTGRCVVTENNLFDVWAAADRLDVGYLLRQCKAFFKRSLSTENCFLYCMSVRLFCGESQNVALDFIVANFEGIRFSEHFCELNFEEMKYIVTSELLATPSEDDVIEVILRWIAFQSTLIKHPNALSSDGDFSSEGTGYDSPSNPDLESDNKMEAGDTITRSEMSCEKSEEQSTSLTKMLIELLESTRYLVISHNFLVHVLACHELVQADSQCQAIVRRIYDYMAQNDLHLEWCPAAALHRKNSAWKNVLVTFRSNYPDYKLTCMNPTKMEEHHDITLASYFGSNNVPGVPYYQDGCLYTITSQAQEIFVYSPVSKSWNGVSLNTQTPRFCILIGQALYLFQDHKEDETTHVSKVSLHDGVNLRPSSVKLQPVYRLMVKETLIKGVTSIGNKIIVFWAESGMTSLTVECYDLARRKSTIISDKLGSTANLITFRRVDEAFVLQTNGALWRIRLGPSPEGLIFTQELQLWDGWVQLKTAVVFGSRLYVGGEDKQRVIPCLTNVTLEGVFDEIVFFSSVSGAVVHAVLPKHIVPAMQSTP